MPYLCAVICVFLYLVIPAFVAVCIMVCNVFFIGQRLFVCVYQRYKLKAFSPSYNTGSGSAGSRPHSIIYLSEENINTGWSKAKHFLRDC